MKKKTVILIVVISVLVLSVGTATGLLIYANKPSNVFGKALQDFPEDFLARREIAPFAQMMKGGSLQIDFCPDTTASRKSYFEFEGTCFFSDDGVLLQDGNLNVFGDEFPFELYFGQRYCYFYNDTEFDGAYGLVRGKASEWFEDSSWYNRLSKSARIFFDLYDEQIDLQNDSREMISNYMTTLHKLISEYADISSERTKTTILDEKVSGRIITIRLDGKAVYSVLRDFVDMLDHDRDFDSFIDSYAPLTSRLFGFDEEDIDDFLDDADSYLEDLRDDMEEDDTEIVFRMVTPKWSYDLLQLTLSMESDNSRLDGQLFDLSIGEKGIAESDTISLSFGDGGVLVYSVSKDTDSRFQSELIWQSSDQRDDFPIFEIEVDRKSEEISVTFGDDYEVVGDFVEMADGFSIKLENFKTGRSSYPILLSAELHERDPMPDPENEKDIEPIFSLGEEIINRIFGGDGFEIIDEFFSELFSRLF